jgi:hypothetical protein
MDNPPTLVVGRVSDVGPTHVVLGKTRIELHPEQKSDVFEVGYSAAVMVANVDGKLVGGRIVRPLVAQPVSQ